MRGLISRLLSLAFIVGVALACANLPEANRRSESRNSTPPIPNTESSTRRSWDYSEYDDQMGRGKVYQASIESTNTISLESPYEGAQHGALVLREHPQYGKDVILTIEKGQLLDSDFNSNVLVRFDSDKPMSFPSVRPADLSSEALFLRGRAFTVFLGRLKTAKTVRIEAPIYQAGNQVFVFDVDGFKWKK